MDLLSTSILTNFSTAPMDDDQNITKNNEQYPVVVPEDWTYTAQAVYILTISVLGIIFNVFVLMVFCLHKKACTVAEIYLSNLAAADLILVSCTTFYAKYTADKYDWSFGRTMCKMVNLGIVMNVYCSNFFLVLISIDRYLALVHPLSHDRMRRPKYVKLACLLVWAFGLLLGIPVLMYRQLITLPDLRKVCYVEYPSKNIELLSEGIVVLLIFIIPISIISLCTFKIIQALKNRLDSHNSERKATTLILAVLVAFLVCWLPFHVVKIMEMLQIADILGGFKLKELIFASKPVVTYLGFFNSVLNPILYVIVGKKFRKKVKELFKQWKVQRTSTLSLESVRTSRTDKFVHASD